MFLINKYSPYIKVPDTLEDSFLPPNYNIDEPLIKNSFFHKDIYDLLLRMSKDNSIPHVIFYGPSGSGKKTMMNLFLEMLFDENIKNTSNVIYEISNSSGKIINESIKQSDYHIVINPTNTNFDRYLIHNVIKKYAKQMSFNAFKTNRPFKCVQINNLNMLSYYAQTALRRTMESYSDKCKFVMWCTSLSKIIKPLKSRCVQIRVYRPNINDMFKYAITVAANENLHISLKDFNSMCVRSEGNIKKLLWEIEYNKRNITDMLEYNNYLLKINNLLLDKNMNSTKIITMQTCLFDIMATNINMSDVMVDILNNLIKSNKISEKNKKQIILESVEINLKLSNARRDIMHIEAFLYMVIQLLQ